MHFILRGLSVASLHRIFMVFTVFLSFSVYASESRAGFLKPGERIFYNANDTLLELCNRAGEPLWIALVYENRRVSPPTFVAKGWFEYSNRECQIIAINGLQGVMSVMHKTDDGELVPFYESGTTSLDDIRISDSEAKIFTTEYLCIGSAPFSTYRDDFSELFECRDGEEKTPFNIRFLHGRRQNFTLTLQ